MYGSIVPPLLESDGAAVEGAGGVTFVAGGDSECHEEDGDGVHPTCPDPRASKTLFMLNKTTNNTFIRS
jgi:hypothetical protein